MASFAAGRRGRATSSPPQFGHLPPSTPSLHERQNVHSKEQMNASPESGGRSRLQHSQFGRSCSMPNRINSSAPELHESYFAASRRKRVGSTATELRYTEKCRCGPVARPLAPTVPMTRPASTISGGETSIDFR